MLKILVELKAKRDQLEAEEAKVRLWLCCFVLIKFSG
jgi:hypothetical protein